MPALFVATKVFVQLDNPLQPPQFQAPVMLEGANIVVDDNGNTLYQPAFIQRPMAKEEFTDQTLSDLNAKLGLLGLELVRKANVPEDNT